MKRRSTTLVLVVALLGAAFAMFERGSGRVAPESTTSATNRHADAPDDSALRSAIAQRASDRWVTGSGIVETLLADDARGDRHQRFVLRIGGGSTVLVAHNIDFAPRIDGLRVGDRVDFSGEYEWNERGGVVHWTHRDPRGRRDGGWLRHAGRTYR